MSFNNTDKYKYMYTQINYVYVINLRKCISYILRLQGISESVTRHFRVIFLNNGLDYEAKMQPSHDPVEIQYTCKTGQRYCFWLELNSSERFLPYIRRLYTMMTVIRNTNTKIESIQFFHL